MYKGWHALSASSLGLFALGFAAAFVSAFACVRWLLRYVAAHDFTAFAWYRIGFGLVIPGPSGWFGEAALQVATAAGELSGYGIEARHLRAFRSAADREVGLVEQVVQPLLRQRGGDARARADDAAREISAVALRLHAALVRAGLESSGLT